MSATVTHLNPGQPRRRRTTKPRPEPELIGMTVAEAFELWARALKARHRSPATIKSYLDTVQRFTSWLHAGGGPDDVEQITVHHIRAYITHTRERTSPGNAHKEYRNLRALFRWCVDEDPPLRSTPTPVLKADEPHVPEVELPPLTDDQVKALLNSCKGSSFADRRDLAILWFFIDSGPRVSGLAGIRYTPSDSDTHDLDLGMQRARIVLKGGDVYYAPYGAKVATALDRYLRLRAKHARRREPWLWLGPKGRFTVSGIEQMVRRRGHDLGIEGVHPHQLRRTSVTAFLDAGGSDLAAMHVYGWKSTAMVAHYTKETARRRAREQHAKLSPGDRF